MTRKEAVEIVEKYIESFEGGAAIWEALKMAADSLKNEDAVIDKVLRIIDCSVEEAETLKAGIGVENIRERKYGMLVEANVIRVCVEALRGEQE